MLRVCIIPQFRRPDRADGGIRRVVEAQRRFLPDYDIQVVDEPSEADLIAVHGADSSDRTDVPVVAHCHGLHWDRYSWPNWAHEINEAVTNTLRRAVAHTAPSEWVSDALRRGMMIYPQVIYHGVDVAQFVPSKKNGGYVLWNKARTDPVSDPQDLDRVAALLLNRKFVTTFGQETPNTKVIGKKPFGEMVELVRNAGVYLATARETFGIGTLEALACGVPVAGWDWGGQSEIVINGETGYLAPPGDFRALARAIELTFQHRARLSEAARADAVLRWQWPDKIRQYAELYKKTAEWWGRMSPKMSVILTCYNLARYLPHALNSMRAQTFQDWECIIVDDCSTDNTQQIAKEAARKDPRFRYVRTPSNLGLVGARNFGFKHTHGRYIAMLDADDMYAPRALRLLAEALDNDNRLHIAYGHLDIVSEDGGGQRRAGWPYKTFSWGAQMAHYNQLPYCALMRREVFERCGGYRLRQWRAEDAEFWCRATSFGFRAAKVTEYSTLIYRMRPDSKSKGEPGDGNWTAWFAWGLAERAGQVPYRDAVANTRMDPGVVPFGAQGRPPRPHRFWPVRDYAYPKISVIIPVGRGHEKYVIDALDSLLAQTFQDWEAIVVNDTGRTWPDGFDSPVQGAPFAKVLSTEQVGPAGARNEGAKSARGEALLFLDADDYLLPGALEKMWAVYEDVGGGVIYTDWLRNNMDGSDLVLHETKDFQCGATLERMQHANTCLVPRSAHFSVGGYDTELEGWEDWDYYIALQAAGLCSHRIAEPLFVYRFHSGTQRENSFGKKEKLVQYIRQKWTDYYNGRKKMPCGGCKKRRVTPRSYPTSAKAASVSSEPSEEMVLLRYQGKQAGPLTFRGRATGTRYRFGLGSGNAEKYVYAEDAEFFVGMVVDGKPVFVMVTKEVR